LNIAVTESEYRKGESVFSSTNNNMKCIPVPDDEGLLVESITSLQVKHVIVGTNKYIGPLYDALPRGSVIARFGIGHDGINKAKVRSANLFCTNTPGVISQSVAELTVALMLASARHIVDVVRWTKTGQWQPLMGTELRDKTLAVIGCGDIGSRVAQMASFGFKMKVIGHDIRELNVNFMKRKYGYSSIVENFSMAVSNADFVTIHIPLMESTKKFINSERLKKIPRSSWLINTSRGAIVDETALFLALKSGIIAGAALDVFVKEPYQPVDKKHDLRLLDNVILSPHIGTTTQDASCRIAKRCLSNIEFAEKGEYEKMDIIAHPDEFLSNKK
jgi:phosphoglycerate dehydrogenase-like enzyme